MRPMLVKQFNNPDGSVWERFQPQMVGPVIRPETARLVRQAMRAVVEHGTGQLADIPRYSVIGKTGTAQKLDRHGVLPGQYYCSFIGMFPGPKPELLIAVAMDDPGGSAYGGTVAAPVFREIAQQAIALYGIRPDLESAPVRPGLFARGMTAARHLVAFSR
jgi:stage V sporulation protein D (sporulation-specific penicillin-binding protein)